MFLYLMTFNIVHLCGAPSYATSPFRGESQRAAGGSDTLGDPHVGDWEMVSIDACSFCDVIENQMTFKHRPARSEMALREAAQPAAGFPSY